MENYTNELKANIERLKRTIQQNCWNEGYVNNMKLVLRENEKELAEIQTCQQ